MNDAQRYRMNAAEYLRAAEHSGSSYRGLTLAISTSWLSLARQQETMDELLGIWARAGSATLAPSRKQRFQYPRAVRPLPPARTAFARSPAFQMACGGP